MHRTLAAAALVALAGCVTTGPVSSLQRLDRSAAAQCTAYCGELGMRLGAVVIVSGSTGCVCQPASASAQAGGDEAAVASGAAVQAAALRAKEQQLSSPSQSPAAP